MFSEWGFIGGGVNGERSSVSVWGSGGCAPVGSRCKALVGDQANSLPESGILLNCEVGALNSTTSLCILLGQYQWFIQQQYELFGFA